MKYKGILIIGTDTGVGKTIVSAALANALFHKGVSLKVFKPFATGARFNSTLGAYSEDALLLKHAAHSNQPLSEINPVLLKTPLAPEAASKIDGIKVDMKKAEGVVLTSIRDGYFTLTEGVGGFLVPLTSKRLLADFAEEIGLPVVLVARSALGTINHTLMTINELEKRRLRLLGVIFNRIKNTGDLSLAEKTSPQSISEFVKYKDFGYFYRVAGARGLLKSPDAVLSPAQPAIASLTKEIY